MNELIRIAKEFNEGHITALEAQNLMILHISGATWQDRDMVELSQALVDSE